MKAKVLSLAILLAVTSLGSSAYAQERIMAWFKKLENVDMNVVRERKNGTLVTTIITVTIKDNEPLVDEFLAAVKAEEANIITIIESTKEGKLVPSLIEFADVTFTFNRSGKNVTISQMDNSEKKKGKMDWGG